MEAFLFVPKRRRANSETIRETFETTPATSEMTWENFKTTPAKSETTPATSEIASAKSKIASAKFEIASTNSEKQSITSKNLAKIYLSRVGLSSVLSTTNRLSRLAISQAMAKPYCALLANASNSILLTSSVAL